MALESFDKQIDIKDLSVETPDRETGVFDPESWLTPEDWDDITIDLEAAKEEGKNVAPLLANLKLAFPHRASFLEKHGYKINDHKLNTYIDSIKNTNFEGYLGLAEYLKILFPDWNIVDEEDWQSYRDYAGDDNQKSMLNLFAGMMRLRILFPDKTEQIDQRYAPALLEKYIPRVLEEMVIYRVEERWGALVHLAVVSRIGLPPDKFDPRLKASDWREMVNWLRVYKRSLKDDILRKEYWWGPYVGMVADMKLLTASKLSLVDGQIQAEYKTEPNLSENPPTVPQERKF